MPASSARSMGLDGVDRRKRPNRLQSFFLEHLGMNELITRRVIALGSAQETGALTHQEDKLRAANERMERIEERLEDQEGRISVLESRGGRIA